MPKEKRKLKTSFDSISTAVIIVDCNHIITHTNAAAVKLFNNIKFDDNHNKLQQDNVNDLIGKNVCDFHQKLESQKNLLSNLDDKIELNFMLGDSDIKMKISPLINESGERLGSISEWEEITEKDKILIELEAANQELIVKNAEKEKRAEELENLHVELMTEIMLQYNEKVKRTNELKIANQQLVIQNLEKEKHADELRLIIAQKEMLNQQVNHLQKLESIGRMTAGIAHDFNNILACIMGYNEMNNDIREDMKQEHLRAELAQNTEQITNAGLRAVALIEKMMIYSRQDTQSIKTIDVEHTTTAINDVLEMLRPALTSRIKIEFTNHCRFAINNDCNGCINQDRCDMDIQIDVVALHQILTNLAMNARDSMKECGGLISISLSKSAASNAQCVACRAIIDGKFIELSVSDKGTGIEPKVLHRIFDPFFTTKSQGEGTGLGLSTLTGLVHSALGHIVIDSDTSELHHGTSFKLFFPVLTENF